MKMPETIDPNMLAPCGMNCMVCYKHCDSPKPCVGCFSVKEYKPLHCRKCKIKDCIREKGISYCFMCEEHPCAVIKRLEKGYRTKYQTSLIENSKAAKKSGVENFMRQQQAKYTCSVCGGIISLHDAMCSECHAKKLDK